MPTLLSNSSSTGDAVNVRAGRYVFIAEGTFGGAILLLERLGPNGSWISAGSEFSLSSAGQELVDLPNGFCRVSVTGGTPSALYAELQRVR